MDGAGWEGLAAGLAGELLRPGTPGYDAARRPGVARFAAGAEPAGIARCAAPADVAAALAWARAAGLPFAVRSGGHCFAGGSSTRGLLIDVGPLDAVAIDGSLATIGAGARLGAVYAALAAAGRAIPAGCGPEVGIAGLTLGGGLGILGRSHGLTADALAAAEVVLADGDVVRCDADVHRDLFWALRGAGGTRVGIVTALVFATVPAPPATAFRLVWDLDDAPALVRAWQAWSPAEPDAMAASLLVRAGHTAHAQVIGAMTAGEAETAERLAALPALAGVGPGDATYAGGSLIAAKRFLSGLGDDEAGGPDHPYNRSEFFARPLPGDVADALVAALCDAPSPGCTRELDLSPWGGAYARVPAGATAFAHRDAHFLLKQSVAAPGALPDRERAWLDGSWRRAHPYGTGGVYPNFAEPERDPWDRAYHGANLERLLEVKRRYDPAGVFGGVAAA